MLAVISSPLRPSGLNSRSSRLNYLRRNFAVPSTVSTRVSPKLDSSCHCSIKALPIEEEKDLGSSRVPAWGTLDLLHVTSYGQPVRDLIIADPVPVPRPLRC